MSDLRERIEKLTRYEVGTARVCGEEGFWIEASPSGAWMKAADVLAIIAEGEGAVTINAAMSRLLDNRWEVLISRDVAGRYMAAAKKILRESWKDVFELVNVDGQPCDAMPESEFDKARYKGHRMSHRIGYGRTPEEALTNMVNSVLGLEEKGSHD